ncbi:MAG: SynChlorMet cassette radical SAM/SPASM protein ScmE [bacterium]
MKKNKQMDLKRKAPRTPRSVEISITNECNLRCKHCSHFGSADEVKNDLPTKDWLKFFAELGRLAVTEVTLCGGEPFLRKDLKELISGIVKNRLRFSILSNGTLITDETAAYIASTKRCNNVQVSIDGSSPETHDILRGGGNFNKAVEGIRQLKKNNIPVAVRVTIFRGNVYELDKIAKLLLDEIGLPGFSTNSASHLGLCRANAEMVQLTVAERKAAMDALLRLNKKYHNRISAAAGPLVEAKTWVEMETARKEGKKELPGRGYLVSCGGVFSKLAVKPNGVIVPCIQIAHLELGQINKDDLGEIWRNHPELIKMRERRNIPLSDFGYCRDCAYVNYCAGGCPALSYTITGDEYSYSPDSCLKKYLADGGELPAETAVVHGK